MAEINEEKRVGFTQEQLKGVLNYDPETGLFTWLVAKGRRVRVGDVAGSLNKGHNYIEIGIDNQKYYAHRLVWLYLFDEMPREQIDHVNGNRSDNRVVNLREVPSCINARSQRKSSRNSSGVTGVSLRKTKQKSGNIIEEWVAYWRDKCGKQLSKSFSVSKYTNNGAKQLAIKCRKTRIQELNMLGFGYSPRHGTTPQNIIKDKNG